MTRKMLFVALMSALVAPHAGSSKAAETPRLLNFKTHKMTTLGEIAPAGGEEEDPEEE